MPPVIECFIRKCRIECFINVHHLIRTIMFGLTAFCTENSYAQPVARPRVDKPVVRQRVE